MCNIKMIQRIYFVWLSILIVMWILTIFGGLTWSEPSHTTRTITIVIGWITLISFMLCPLMLVYRYIKVNKRWLFLSLAIPTLLSYVPFFVQRRTHISKICTCCDEYLIPEDIMEYIFIIALILTLSCYLVVGYTAFKTILQHKRDI